MEFDLCVVGAGPAGAFLARAARRRGHSVALVGKPSVGNARVETLSPEAIRLLREEALDGCLSASGAQRSSGTIDGWRPRSHAERRASIFEPHGAAWHVERATFDAALREGARDSGAELLDVDVTGVVVTNRGFQVSSSSRRICCRHLVDATGSTARVARLLHLRRRVLDRQVVISARIAWSMPEPALVVTSFRDGWIYVVPLRDVGVQLTVITDRTVVREQGTAGLLRSALSHLELEPGILPSEVRTSGAVLQIVDGQRPTRFASIGDAAWTPDPLSGHGIARAFESALRLAVTPDATAPAPLVADYLRARAQLFAGLPWSDAPHYRNRLRAWRHAEETFNGNSLAME